MSTQTKQDRILSNCIRLLRGEGSPSPEVRAALTDPLKLYLETYVIGALRTLIKPKDGSFRDLDTGLELSRIQRLPEGEG